MSAHAKAAKDALDLAITNYRYNAAMVKRTLKSSSPNERSLNHDKVLFESSDIST